MLHLLKEKKVFSILSFIRGDGINDDSPLLNMGGRVLIRLILLHLILGTCSSLFANAAEIRNGVLSNIQEFVTLRDPNSTHGNEYAFDDTAIITADYELPTINYSLFAERIIVTYYTKVTIALGGYPDGNKVVVQWGDNQISTHYINGNTVNYVTHQYVASVNNYLVSIKTYRHSGNTYIEEPDHEIQYDLGIFPYTETVSIASNDEGIIGELTHYQSTITGLVKKPVLIVEGFNFHNSNNVSSIVGLNPAFFNGLLNCGFDLYFLTFKQSQASLYENAGLVLSALNCIKGKHEGSGEYSGFGCQPIKVIGYSMGGVLARIALASAEDQGEFAHSSNLLLTVDSPHRGLVINENVQRDIKKFFNKITSLSSGTGDQVSGLLEIFDTLIDSPIARQLVRNNITAESTPYTFFDGSNEYKDVFDFLNPCETRNVAHINQDWDYYNSSLYNEELDFKSGFPWKQNNIRKCAAAFGSSQPVGNTNNHSNFASLKLKWKILGFPGSYTFGSIASEWYDKCPASYFPTEFHYNRKVFDGNYSNLENILLWIINSDKLKIHFNVNYDLPIVPVISSLCITNRDFAEPSQTQFTPYGATISNNSLVPFDDYFISNDANPHTVLSPQCAQWITNRLSDNVEERIIGHVTGVLRFNSQPLVNQPIIVTNLITGDVFELDTNASGTIQFENYYVNTCEYEIKHANNIYYENVVSAYVDLTGNVDIGTIDFTAPQHFVLVDKNPSSNACHTVSNAFEVAISLGIPHIKVYQGTYLERVYVPDLGSNIQDFILEGLGTVIIRSDSRGRPLRIGSYGTYHWVNEITIKNIIFEDSDGDGGGGVGFYGNINHVTMQNCTVRNCGDNYQIYGSQDIPIGLESYVPIHLTGCKFYNNNGEQHGPSRRTYGSIYLHVPISTNHSIIEHCQIYDNQSSSASAIYVAGKGLFTIRNNIIQNNQQKMSGYTSCLVCRDAESVEISNNIFRHNYLPNADDSHFQSAIGLSRVNYDSTTYIIKNNTIVEQSRALYVYNAAVTATNNVFDIFSVGIRCYENYDSNRLQYSHNIMKLGNNAIAAQNYNINLPTNQCNQFCDPLLDANYVPIWNLTTMSPCIDAGTGENDADGTPPDIGAFSAVAHDYWEYTFHDQSDTERWHWVSYPILNTITDDALIASEFFEELLHVHQITSNGYLQDIPTYMEEIQWIVEGNEESLYWNNVIPDWCELVYNHSVSSPQGYKIRLQQRSNPNFPYPVVLKESGFQTPVGTKFPIYGGVENWLGYFHEEARMPQDAFADIWDDISLIKAKDWSLIRMPGNGNIWGMQGRVMPLQNGDMVIVRTNQDHSFRWGVSHPVPPRTKSAPEQFVFDEKADYIPIYINIADEIRPGLKEIGLLVNGVCKGAVVVEDSLEQISAYVANASELSEGDIEFVFYYEESKSAGAQMRKVNVPTGKLNAKYGVAGSTYPYFAIDLDDNALENVVPFEFTLKQNYPNPFNPSTTIQYSLPEAAKVHLEIYNIKGQLVTTLVNSEMPAGMHSIVWNGKDMNNRIVASGVYLYRLSSPQNTQTKRMLLMK